MIKKILIGLIALLVAVAIVGGLWFYFLVRPPTAPETIVLPPADDIFPTAPTPTIPAPTPPLPPEPITTSTSTGEQSSPAPTEEVSGPIFRQLADVAIAGAMIRETSTSTPPKPYYIERATGHLYSASPDAAGSAEKMRLAATTRPSIRRVFWGQDSKGLLRLWLQQEEGGNVRNVLASLTNEELLGPFLADSITEVAVSPDGRRFFYLDRASGRTEGYTQPAAEGGVKTKVWTSVFVSWHPDWVNPDVIALTPKASSIARGGLYLLNLKTKALEPVLTGLLGLTARVSPSLAQIVYTETKGNTFTSYIYNRALGTAVQLPFTTLAEKCLFNQTSTTLICAVPITRPAGAYPDAWYRGQITFSDELWQYNIATGQTTQLSSVGGEAFDMTNLILSADQNHIYFTNKTNQTWWEFKLGSRPSPDA